MTNAGFLGDVIHYAPLLYGGLGGFGRGGLALNVGLTVCTLPLAFVVGAVLGCVRALRVPAIAQLIFAYTELVKSVPLLLLLFWLHYILPVLLGVHLPLFAVALVALTAFGSANVAEVVRSGFGCVGSAEVESARLAGLTRLEVARFIVVPQALSAMWPALLSVSITLFKDTSLVFAIGLIELTQSGMLIANRYPDKLLTMYMLIGLGYFLVCSSLSYAGIVLRRRHGRERRVEDMSGLAWQD